MLETEVQKRSIFKINNKQLVVVKVIKHCSCLSGTAAASPGFEHLQ